MTKDFQVMEQYLMFKVGFLKGQSYDFANHHQILVVELFHKSRQQKLEQFFLGVRLEVETIDGKKVLKWHVETEFFL